MALKFNFFEWLTRRRTTLYPKLSFDLRCTACQHQFQRKLRRVYVDLNLYDQRQLTNRRPKRSEFIIPETITCPKCQAVDQANVTSTAYHHLAKMPLMSNNGIPSPHTPIQCIRFSLRNGRPIHPLDGLEYLAAVVGREPENSPIRLEYANLLRMLGQETKAEAQFLQVLEREPIEPEALLNMAVFHGKRHEKEEAVDCLLKVVNTLENSPHPDHDLFAEAAQAIMDGEIQMDAIELTAPMLFDIDAAVLGNTRFQPHPFSER